MAVLHQLVYHVRSFILMIGELMRRIFLATFAFCLLQIGFSAEADTFSKDVKLNLDVLDVRESIALREPTIPEDVYLIPPEPELIDDVEDFSQGETIEPTETTEEIVDSEATADEMTEEYVEEEVTEEATDIVPEESEVSEEESIEEYEEDVTDVPLEEEVIAAAEEDIYIDETDSGAENEISESMQDEETSIDVVEEQFSDSPEEISEDGMDATWGLIFVVVLALLMVAWFVIRRSKQQASDALEGSKESVAEEETPAEEEPPAEEKTPAEEEPPAEEKTPAEEEPSAEEEAPAEKEPSAEEEAPAKDETSQSETGEDQKTPEDKR